MYVYDRRTRVATELVVHPQNILHRALMNGLITPEEARTHKFQHAAEEAAYNVSEGWPEGEGFGSSDMTFVIQDMLSIAGIKTEFVNHRLTRKDHPVEKEAAALDMDLAKTYADAWSDTLIGKLAPKFLTPKALGTVLRDKWIDVMGYETRSLQWRSARWMKPAEWAQQMKAICPEYNGFHAGKVGSWLSRFSGVEVQPAREYSVCLYIKGKPEELTEIMGQAKQARADEIDMQDDGTLRLWWD